MLDYTAMSYPALSGRIQLSISLGLVAYLAFVGIARADEGYGDFVDNAFYLGALALYLLLLVLPIFLPLGRGGILNPLLLTGLFTLASTVGRQTEFFITGLQSHDAIPHMSRDDLHYLVIYGWLLQSLALLCTYAAFYSNLRIRVPDFVAGQGSGKYFPHVALLVIGCAFGAVIYYVGSAGGISEQIVRAAKGVSFRLAEQNTDAYGQYVVLLKAAATILLFWLCAEPNATRRILFWVSAVGVFSGIWIITGKRASLIVWAYIFMCGWMFSNRKVPVGRLVLFGVLAFVVLGVLGLVRTDNWTRTSDASVDALRSVSIGELVRAIGDETTMRSGQGNLYYAVLAHVPTSVDLLYGVSLLENGYRFIPRALWVEKPRGIDVRAARVFMDADHGIPIGPVGEAYWNGHVLGVIVLFVALGLFYRWLYDALLANLQNAAIGSLYIISVVMFGIGQPQIGNWMQTIIPAVLLYWLAGGLQTRQPFVTRLHAIAPSQSLR